MISWLSIITAYWHWTIFNLFWKILQKKLFTKQSILWLNLFTDVPTAQLRRVRFIWKNFRTEFKSHVPNTLYYTFTALWRCKWVVFRSHCRFWIKIIVRGCTLWRVSSGKKDQEYSILRSTLRACVPTVCKLPVFISHGRPHDIIILGFYHTACTRFGVWRPPSNTHGRLLCEISRTRTSARTIYVYYTQ